MNLDKYQGIIFDMDGTLIDSMPLHMEAWRQTCEIFNYEFDIDYISAMGGVPSKQIAHILNDKFGQDHDPLEVAKTKRGFWDQSEEIPGLIRVTNDILNRYENVLPIAIGTGSERKHAEQLLTHHGLLNRLTALVTATDVSKGKPHPETFLTAAELMQVPASRCVVFEDTEIGYRAAKDAGMDCILVENGELIIP